MNQLAKLTVVALIGVACAACSNSQAPSTPPASAPPPASAIPMHAPTSGATADTVDAPPANGPSLAQIMRRPGFAKAFDAMDGAAALPAWAKQGGVASPSQHVEINGKAMLLAQSCEAEGCQSGRLLVLIDPAAHAMQGVLSQVSGSAGAQVRQLAWLGKPDATTQAFLQGQLNGH